MHKQNKSVPNAVVHHDIHGPFPSYEDQNFMAVLTYEATFVAMAGKTTDGLAATCFVEWICKMSVPQFIDTNLSKDQAEDLKEELNTCLNQDIPHNPFIDANRGSCFNKKAVDGIRKMANTAKLRWQAFLLALNLAHNTAYQSTMAWMNGDEAHGFITI